MDALTFETGGKKKIIERRMTLNCVLCRATLICPDDVDPWGWLREHEDAFRAEHAGHARAVGAQIESFDKDE